MSTLTNEELTYHLVNNQRYIFTDELLTMEFFDFLDEFYSKQSNKGAMKPCCVQWYSVGSSWLKWMIDEEFYLKDYKYVYAITLDESVMLKVDDLTKVKEFGNRYKSDRNGFNIKWKEVYDDGHRVVEFSGYKKHNELLDTFLSYSSFDCSSGIIFDKQAITSIRLAYQGSLVEDKWTIV